MITLMNGYIIKADSMQYTLCKERQTKDKETGEEKTVLDTVGYYISLEGALEGAYRKLARERMSKDEAYTLAQAIKELKDLKLEIQALARGL